MRPERPSVDGVEADNRRHKEEERRRKEKRRQRREGEKSEAQKIKEAKRKAHTQRVLSQANKKKPPPPDSSHKGKDRSSSDSASLSEFQNLFAKRSEGFMLEFRFRNAPPRPPVGPCFVGYSLDNELDRWSRYRENTTEKYHVYKLHTEADLGIPLAVHAMIEDNYNDSSSLQKKRKHDAFSADDDDENKAFSKRGMASPEPLHPDDEALLNWEGSLGDSAAEAIQVSRDRKRAEALSEALAPSSSKSSTSGNTSEKGKKLIIRRNVKAGSSKATQSRVLEEENQSWMKKTTYIYNDPSSSVHKFKSLADTKKRTAEQVEEMVTKNKAKFTDPEEIAKGFNKVRTSQKKPRIHPTKKHLKVVAEYDLLPDLETWAHTYTHVVIDNPPKQVSKSVNKKYTNEALESAYIADVKVPPGKSKMECNLLVPLSMNKAPSSENTSETAYDLIQKYDLDVVALKHDDDAPHVNFLLFLNEDDKTVTYHPISSRVQLVTGRPPASNTAVTYIEKKELNNEEITHLEKIIAEVDLDMAEKYEETD